jgi:hypothetical protein
MSMRLWYAARAVPASAMVVGTLLVVAVVQLMSRWPQSFRLLSLVLAVLVALAAWSADEPAAAIVDATPRSFAWRTTSRMLTLVPAVAAWCLFAVVMAGRPAGDPGAGHLRELLAAGWAALLLGASVTAVLRRRGRSEPGAAVAGAVGLTVVALGFFPSQVPIFPEDAHDHWLWAERFWVLVTGIALVTLAGALVECRHRD